MSHERVYRMIFAKVYPAYVNKAEKKGRTKAELDQIIEWLMGYDAAALAEALEDGRDVEAFVRAAPRLNPDRNLIKGVVCGVRVEEVEDEIMRELRYLDKLVDELAKGKAMEQILRTPAEA